MTMLRRCEERFGSPVWSEGKTPEAKRLYTAFGAEDEVDAMTMVIAESPAIDYSLAMLRQQISGLQEVGPNLWTADVDYAPQSGEEEGSWEYVFDGTGGTAKITQSLGTRSATAIFGKAPDFGGAVGVTENGVEGCEITIPVYSFGISYHFSSRFINLSYGAVCGSLTGKINGSAFKGFARGTVLYLGPVGRFSGSMAAVGRTSSVELTHRFAVSPHMTVMIGGKRIQKYGWDYLWCRYINSIDAKAKACILVPQAVYCEMVYQEGNFGGLGIGY